MVAEPTFVFDARTQREVVDNPHAARAWVTHLQSIGMAGDPMRVVWLRIVGDLDDAAELGWRVLHRSGGPGAVDDLGLTPLPLSAVTAAVRLGHVVQWQKNFALAHELFDHGLEAIEATEPLGEDAAYAEYLRPFALQHQARCYFDEGRYSEALGTSQLAHDLRVMAGVPEDQVLSSTGLISAVLQLLQDSHEAS